MSEMRNMNSAAIRSCRKNYRMRSWVYAVAGIYFVLLGFAVYVETRPFVSMAAIALGFASMKSSANLDNNGGRFLGLTAVAGGILGWVACFL